MLPPGVPLGSSEPSGSTAVSMWMLFKPRSPSRPPRSPSAFGGRPWKLASHFWSTKTARPYSSIPESGIREFPAYVITFTDYSPNRKTPLERDIRSLVIASVNNQPVRVEDVVEGGRISPGELPGDRGVVVSHQTRLGRIGYWKADHQRPPGSPLSLADVGHDEDDKVQCIVLLRKNEDTIPALRDVEAKVKDL